MQINIRSYIRNKSALIDLKYNDPAESKAICEQLLMYHLKVNRAMLYLNNEFDISEELYTIIENDFTKLQQHVPLQYITKEAPFRKLMLKIEQGVLIPRPETEELVELVINKEDLKSNIKVLDACTGSGCIAISLKSEFPNLNVFAFDFDKNVLKLAEENAKLYNANINFFNYDLLKDEPPQYAVNFDIIISNPPYVLQSEKNQISKRVLLHEPDSALFVDNNNPLLYYKKILQHFTCTKCRFYFEINPLTIHSWKNFLNKSNLKFEIFKDLNNKNRFIRIEM